MSLLVATSLAAFALGQGCNPASQLSELSISEDCQDGRDNDGNRLIDCADPACGTHEACSEYAFGSLESTCATLQGDRSETPIDIIWIIDGTGSMRENMGRVQQNLNEFVGFLTKVRFDVRVVLIGAPSICVPEPLGGPNCSDGENFRHIGTYVSNHNSLRKLIELYPDYRGFLRGKRTFFVVTTDDESDADADWFESQVRSRSAFGADYVFHSIVSYGQHPRFGCLNGIAPGNNYLELSARTGGITHPICEGDWREMFAAMQRRALEYVSLPCSYAIPPAPEGQRLDPPGFVVSALVGGLWSTLPQVPQAEGCEEQPGWYFDNPDRPEQVKLCPRACRRPDHAQIEVKVGCRRQLANVE